MALLDIVLRSNPQGFLRIYKRVQGQTSVVREVLQTAHDEALSYEILIFLTNEASSILPTAESQSTTLPRSATV